MFKRLLLLLLPFLVLSGVLGEVTLVNTTTQYNISNGLVKLVIQSGSFPQIWAYNGSWFHAVNMNTAFNCGGSYHLITDSIISLSTEVNSNKGVIITKLNNSAGKTMFINHTIIDGLPTIISNYVNETCIFGGDSYYYNDISRLSPEYIFLKNETVIDIFPYATYPHSGDTNTRFFLDYFNSFGNNIVFSFGSNINMYSISNPFTYNAGGVVGFFHNAATLTNNITFFRTILTNINTSDGSSTKLPDTLNNSVSATYWGATQTASFAETFANLSLTTATVTETESEGTVSRSYAYSLIPNDFGVTTTYWYTYPYESGNRNPEAQYYTGVSYIGIAESDPSPTTYLGAPDISITSPENSTYWDVLPNEATITITGILDDYTCTINANDDVQTLTLNDSEAYNHAIVSDYESNSVSVNCAGWYTGSNSTETLYYYVNNTPPTITIHQPLNSTYRLTLPNQTIININGNLTEYDCFINLNDNITSFTGAQGNNTLGLYKLNSVAGINTLTANCQAVINNGTSTRYYTVFSHNVTTGNVSNVLTQGTYNYNMTLNLNPELINITGVIANLTLDGTTYQPNSCTTSTSTVYCTRNITMKTLSTVWNETIQHSWYYHLPYLNSTSTTTQHTITNQTLYKPFIGNCSTIGTNNINFYMRDEGNQSLINATISAGFTLTSQNNTFYGYSNSGESNYSLCVYPDHMVIPVTAVINYESEGYGSRYYTLTDGDANTGLSTVNLYSLLTSSGSNTVIKLIDSASAPVSDYVIIARRERVSDGLFEAVTSCVTDDNGECSIITEWNTVRYDFQIKSDTNELIKTSSPTYITSSPVTISVDLFNLYNYWNQTGSLIYNNSFSNFNNTDYNYTVNVLDLSGSAVRVELDCYQVRMTGNVLIDSKSVNSYSASLTCELGDTNDNYYKLTTRVYYANQPTIIFTEDYSNLTPFNYGADSLVLVFIIYATTTLSALANPIIGLILGSAAVAITQLTGMTSMNPGTSIALIILGIISAIIINRGLRRGSY